MDASRRIQIDPHLPLCTKLSSKYMKYPKIISVTLNLMKENVKYSVEFTGTKKAFKHTWEENYTEVLKWWAQHSSILVWESFLEGPRRR